MITNKSIAKIPTITDLANIISTIFHPLAIPLYVVIIILFSDNYINSPTISITTKLLIILITALTTIILPIYCAILATKFFKENKRNVYMLVFTLFYFITMYVLYPYFGKPISQKLFMTIAIVTSVANTLDYYKSVSMHLVGIYSLLAFLIIINYAGFAFILPVVLTCIIASGLLFSSRLVLKKTTPLNGVASMLLGAGLTAILVYI